MREDRLNYLRGIEKKRESTVISYISGDRDNVGTRIAPDAVRVIFRHLELIGKTPRIDLFLYTRGGDVLTPWRLLNLFMEYTPEFNVIVPFRSYSAGTLICLGANEIIMGKMGELGPVDPVVANAFNPKDPHNPSLKIPISVEDVSSYLSLAEKVGNLKEEDSLLRVYSHLVEKVHPLSLGNVHRNYLLIRMLARKLLRLAYSNYKENEINAIIDYLTRNLYAHNYMISRKEARDEIGLKVKFPDEELEELIWALFESYESDLQLREPFTPYALNLNPGQKANFKVCGGMIESSNALDSFIYHGTVERRLDGGNGLEVNILDQRWEVSV